MNSQSDDANSASLKTEAFLAGTFGRIQRTTIVLAMATVGAGFLFFGWRSGLGAAIGSIVGFLNLVWLHHGAAMMIERVLPSNNELRPKSRLVLSFLGRYIFVLAIAYVILKGFPSILRGFTVALFLPVLAAMCEGVYEAAVNIKLDETLH